MRDRTGWQGSKDLRIPDAITFVLLSPYAPELNPLKKTSGPYLYFYRVAISVFESNVKIVGRCAGAWNGFAGDTEAVRSITTRDDAKAVNGQDVW